MRWVRSFRRLGFWTVLGVSQLAIAGGLDRDAILTEAPATPDSGTVRVSAGGGSTQTTDSTAETVLSGTVMWAPADGFAADVGAYFQSAGTTSGPSARVRYQFFAQKDVGFDLAGGIRYKSAGFDPNEAEVELLVAAGRRVGRFDLMFNTVMGFETAGGGKDLELKGFAGYRISDSLRAGLDSRIQVEVGDSEQVTGAAAQGGSDLDAIAGPAMSWMVTKSVQLQGVVGVAKPKGALRTGATGQLFVSIDI
jgi:hypothetical protein